jgi:hypothetical protein
MTRRSDQTCSPLTSLRRCLEKVESKRSALETLQAGIRLGDESITNELITAIAQEYDLRCFSGNLFPACTQLGYPVSLFASGRLTRVGARTRTTKRPTGIEITVSRPIVERSSLPGTVCGLKCATRFEVLSRLLEHELVHVLELIVFGNSDCSSDLFRWLARTMFGHTESTHSLSQRLRC